MKQTKQEPAPSLPIPSTAPFLSMSRVALARIPSFVLVSTAILLALIYLPKSSFSPRTAYGPILHEETSDFSKIRVRGTEGKRHLLFVSDAGKEQLQSTIHLEDPGTLQVAYTRALFASLLFHHPQERVLVVGLGGGGMIRFLDQHFPATLVEAVEIDPVVVRLADTYFETRENEQVTIHTADAFDFLRTDCGPYDAIYMDAFLRPSIDGTEGSETARLKTVAFLETIRERLTPEGILACNLISYRKTTPEDIEALAEVFPTVVSFSVPGTGNLVVIASRETPRPPKQVLRERARQLDQSLDVGLSFAEFAEQVREED